MIKKNRFILLLSFLFVVGCSGEEDKAASGSSDIVNPLQDQVDALEKAKSVEKMLQDEVSKRHQAMEEQAR